MSMETKIMYIFTRTPLHVGAGASVGAIDQPVQRERHTGFPIIPGSAIKGVFADAWSDDDNLDGSGKRKKESDLAWLFGIAETEAPPEGGEKKQVAAAGAVQFSEAQVLAFPVRSAKGSFAWITCPLILRRYARTAGIDDLSVREPSDDQAIYMQPGILDLNGKIVLEEYTFSHADNLPEEMPARFKNIIDGDPVWKEVENRLVILSDGMMSFFCQSACEVAQHVKIDDATGTAEGGALFNQENVPSETLFYAPVHFFNGRGVSKERTADKACNAFQEKLNANGKVFQFGGDASTGLGFCSVEINGNSSKQK